MQEPSEKGVGNTGNVEIPTLSMAAQIFKSVTGFLKRETGGTAADLSAERLFRQANSDRKLMGLRPVTWEEFLEDLQ